MKPVTIHLPSLRLLTLWAIIASALPLSLKLIGPPAANLISWRAALTPAYLALCAWIVLWGARLLCWLMARFGAPILFPDDQLAADDALMLNDHRDPIVRPRKPPQRLRDWAELERLAREAETL